jgi:TonB family protein
VSKPQWLLLLLAVGLGLTARATGPLAASWWKVEPVAVPPALYPAPCEPGKAVDDDMAIQEDLLFGFPLVVGGKVTRPVPLLPLAVPRLTEVARRARIQGDVIVEAIINERGGVDRVRVLRPLPLGLDRQAIEAVKAWRFQPATFQGEAVKVYDVLTVHFKLPDR